MHIGFRGCCFCCLYPLLYQLYSSSSLPGFPFLSLYFFSLMNYNLYSFFPLISTLILHPSAVTSNTLTNEAIFFQVFFFQQIDTISIIFFNSVFISHKFNLYNVRVAPHFQVKTHFLLELLLFCLNK